jgi:hypothetical protein
MVEIWVIYSVIAAKNMNTLLLIVERSSIIIANKDIIKECPTCP